MRSSWIVPSVILLILMLIFVYVPLPYSESHGLNELHPLILFCPQVLPSSTPSPSYCLQGDAPVQISWTGGNSSTWVQVIVCKTFGCTEVSNLTSPVPHSPSLWSAVGTGGSGSINAWFPTAASMELLTNSSSGVSVTVQWNVMPEFAVIWEALTLVGLLLATIGILLPARPRTPRRRDDSGYPEDEPYEGENPQE